jgi:hypothetical protein
MTNTPHCLLRFSKEKYGKDSGFAYLASHLKHSSKIFDNPDIIW